MNDLASVQREFRRQHRRFRELYTILSHPKAVGPKIAAPSSVLSFAEALLLCPTEDAVLARMQRDQEGARGYYIVANDVAALDATGRAVFAIPPTPCETPFGLLSEIVIVWSKTSLEKHADSWGLP